jgi:hypothetical protein
MSFKGILSAKSILESIRGGLNREQLMDKYGLSPTELSIVLSRLLGERDRRTTQIIQDFLSGLQIQEIAERNAFSAERFIEVLRLALYRELKRRPLLTAETERTSFESEHAERRRYTRISSPVLMARIIDQSRPEREGSILDISEKGVAVKGINVRVDDEKTLLIGEATFDSMDPIVLTCLCRWTGKEEAPELDQSAGFEITKISESDDRYLKSVIEAERRLTCSL